MAQDNDTGKRGYHHGNLRQALIEAAIALIEERGPQGFTMAEAARTAGVSPAAPYRHFKGREELIAEVARLGFGLFADRLETAWSKSPGSALTAFEAVGRAYLDFARSNPGHYIAMFESGISVAGNPELNDAADRAIGVIDRCSEALFAHLPPAKRPPTRMVSHHIWALSHGVVELFSRGVPGGRAPYSPEDLLESGTSIYLRGLGLLPDID